MTTRPRLQRLKQERERLRRVQLNGPSLEMYRICGAGTLPNPPRFNAVFLRKAALALDPKPFRDFAKAIDATNRLLHDAKSDPLRIAFLKAFDRYRMTRHPRLAPGEAPNLHEIQQFMEQKIGPLGEHGPRIVRRIARSLGLAPGKPGRPSRKLPRWEFRFVELETGIKRVLALKPYPSGAPRRK